MKITIRFLAAVTSLLALFGQAFAEGVIAKLATGIRLADMSAQYPEIKGGERAGRSPFVRFEVESEDAHNLIVQLNEDPRVLWVEPDQWGGENAPRSSHGSSVAAIYDPTAMFDHNDSVWEQINYAPVTILDPLAPIKVGIVDTGVSPYQPAIVNNIIASASFMPGSITIDDLPNSTDSNGNGLPDEFAGHGTMVAGLIHQLAPSAPLIIAKSADSDGNGSAWSLLQGVVFCVENGSNVINVSLGSVSYITAFSEVVDWVEGHNVLIVSPIGNNETSSALFPSAYSNVVCVAGLDPDNVKASFSNWSSSALVSAPATGIESAWWDGGSAVFSGTSLSAPLVVGCIAALPIEFPSVSQLRQAIHDTGTNIDPLNPGYQGKLGKLLNFGALYQYFVTNP